MFMGITYNLLKCISLKEFLLIISFLFKFLKGKAKLIKRNTEPVVE